MNKENENKIKKMKEISKKRMNPELKLLNLKQDRNFFFSFLLFGAVLNLFAISLNGGMMPVKTDIEFETTHHFSFQNLSEIKMWILTDIISIGDLVVFSLGDGCVIIGVMGFLIINVRMVKLYRNNQKIERRY